MNLACNLLIEHTEPKIMSNLKNIQNKSVIEEQRQELLINLWGSVGFLLRCVTLSSRCQQRKTVTTSFSHSFIQFQLRMWVHPSQNMITVKYVCFQEGHSKYLGIVGCYHRHLNVFEKFSFVFDAERLTNVHM